jgi:hypothetical protein
MTDGGAMRKLLSKLLTWLGWVSFAFPFVAAGLAWAVGVWHGGWTELFNTSYLNMASVFVYGVTGGLLMWIGEKLKPREENQPSS